MAANAMNGVKMEDGGYIKQDPDSSSPAPMLDDVDLYEDIGELSIPQNLRQNLWLARLPNNLWEILDKLEDDEPIQIGTLASRLQLTLPLPDDVPKDYDMRLARHNTTNTYVFSEKDQADFKAGVYRRPQRPGLQGIQDPSSRVDKKRRGRTIIPKSTALAGAIGHELTAVPIGDPSQAPIPPRRKASPARKILDLADEKAIKQRIVRRGDPFENIAIASKMRKRRPQDNKAVRIGESELINMIFDLFKEYQYWSLKNLRDKTRQPEQYLKEVLSQIAVMARSGPFSNLWMLKPETRDSVYSGLDEVPPEEAAPEVEGIGTDQEGEEGFEDDVDVGDEEMVDVLDA